MPVSSLLERMRKKLQEKAAATNPNTGDGTGTNTKQASSSAETGGSGTGGGGAGIGASAAPQRSETVVPLPPPVFASPSSARLDYRDVVGDPLCVPFTADMAAPLLERVLELLTAPQTATAASPAATEEGKDASPSTPEALSAPVVAPGGTMPAVYEPAAQHLRELLSVLNAAPAHPPVAAPPPSPPPPSGLSLYDDHVYNAACAQGMVEVAGSTRPMCRDVNFYTRVGRISQGVYGVVFQAVAATEDVDGGGESAASQTLGDSAPTQSMTPLTTHTPCGGATPPPPASRRSYALKHIKKMWLEESQVGFPPYLLREIDLLLRLRHPNIMGARELVLLDPAPVPQAAAASAGNDQGSRRPPSKRQREPGEGFTDASPPPPPQQRQRTEASSPGTNNHHDASGTTTAHKPPAAAAAAAAAARPLAAVGAVSETKDVFLVMDYCPVDLTNYMRRYHTTHTHQVPYFHITSRNAHPDAVSNYVARAKSIAYQLFRAVAFLHENRVMHRDLKTSNVLLDTDGYVKVCDFGLGRLYREGQGLTPTVVTLMYRAPELHLGVVDYSHKMDVWSLGCILAELFLRRPLFHASTDSHHLLAVCDVIGIPTEETFAGLYHLPHTKVMMQSLPRWNRVSRLADLFRPGATMATPTHGATPLAAEAALLPPEGVDLLQSILQWNPRRRPSAAAVLQHPFFCTAPLPCAPAELMRPMPWQDAALPSAAARCAPPPPVSVQPSVPDVAAAAAAVALKGAATAEAGGAGNGVAVAVDAGDGSGDEAIAEAEEGLGPLNGTRDSDGADEA